MITKYSTPIQNPYIPQPWDIVAKTQEKNQSMIMNNEELRQKYGQQSQAMKFAFDRENMARKEKYQGEALSDMEEGSLFLSSLKAYGTKDNARLQELKRTYLGRAKELADKYADNPFALAAGTRAFKNQVKNDVVGGELNDIQGRYKQAEEMKDVASKMRMSGHFGEDYYKAQYNNLLSPIPQEPNLQEAALKIAKDVAEKNYDIHDLKQLTNKVGQNLLAMYPEDKRIRMMAGRSEKEIDNMYYNIAQNAAATQVTVPGGRGSMNTSGSYNTTGYSSAYVDPDLGTRSYNHRMIDDPKEKARLDDIYTRGVESFNFIDKKTGKLYNGDQILKDNSSDKHAFDVKVVSEIDPASSSFIKYGNNFKHAYEVMINNKTYIAPGLSQGAVADPQTKVLNDKANFDIALANPGKVVEFTSQITNRPVRVSHNAMGYILNDNGKIYTGQTPLEVFQQYTKQ